MYVYILKNPEGKIYIGQTGNLEKRVREHNETGKGYTSKYRPWKLVYSEEVSSRSLAMEREKYYKSGVGRDWLKENILRG